MTETLDCLSHTPLLSWVNKYVIQSLAESEGWEGGGKGANRNKDKSDHEQLLTCNLHSFASEPMWVFLINVNLLAESCTAVWASYWLIGDNCRYWYEKITQCPNRKLTRTVTARESSLMEIRVTFVHRKRLIRSFLEGRSVLWLNDII